MKPEVHATRQLLVDATVKLLDEVTFEEINAVMVLDATGVSKSSLYHFFEDFSDLLEQALLVRFQHTVNNSAGIIKDIIRKSGTQEEFFNALDGVTRVTQDRANAAVRFERARILARSEKNERFRTALGEVQQQLTDSLTEAFEMAQSKGYLNTSFEPRTGAVFIQSYTLGRAVDDITTSHMNDEDWNHLISRIMRQVMGNF